MILNTPADDSREQLFDDLRQLMARQAKLRDARARSPIGILAAGVRIANGLIAELLESRIIVGLGACLSIVFVALLIQGPQRNNGLSTDLIATSKIDQASASRETPERSADTDISVDSHEIQIVEDPTPETNEAFVIKVGAFRDASNAQRVVERLRKQTLDVKTEVLAGGLHVVMLGPFSQKGAAEEIARSVQDAIGLAPEVLRRDFE
jgi:sporulation related protein